MNDDTSQQTLIRAHEGDKSKIALARSVCTLSLAGQLLGRNAEISTLRSIWHQSRHNKPKPVFVTGTAGIGKTALVQHCFETGSERPAYFAVGKFNQYENHQPFIAIRLALQLLVQQIQTRPAHYIADLRQQLATSVADMDSLLVHLCPELSYLLPDRLSVPAFDPIQASLLLQKGFSAFLNTVAGGSSGIILFIDDLQWMDGASLNLLANSIPEFQSGLLFVGAYRTEEIDIDHPVEKMIQKFEDLQVSTTHVRLSNLRRIDNSQWISNALGETSASVQKFADRIWEKTAGNPFFVQHLVNELFQSGSIVKKEGLWVTNFESLSLHVYTDNVVEVLLRTLNRMPLNCRKCLTMAACIGSQFELAALAIVTETSDEAVWFDLAPALQEGLLRPVMSEAQQGRAKVLQFSHDKIQQSAYNLIDKLQLPALHLSIGTQLLADKQSAYFNSHTFMIADHLTRASSLLSKSDQVKWLETNSKAAAIAKKSTAYTEALCYLTDSEGALANLSGVVGQESADDLSHQYWAQRGELEYCTAQFDRCYASLNKAIQYTSNNMELARVELQRMIALTAEGRFLEAKEVGIKSLALLGFVVPIASDSTTIADLYQDTLNRIGDRSIESLLDLPKTTDQTSLEIAKVLMHLGPPTFVGDPSWFPVGAISAVNHALNTGNCAWSASAYAMLGIWVGHSREYSNETAYAFGSLGYRLAKRTANPSCISMCSAIFGGLVSHWVEPLLAGEAICDEGYEAGINGGELLWGIYSLQLKTYLRAASGHSLHELQVELDGYCKIAQKYGNIGTEKMIVAYQLAFSNLLGDTESIVSYTWEHWSEKDILESGESPYLFVFDSMRAQISFLYGDYQKSLDYSYSSDRNSQQCRGSVATPENALFQSLSLLRTSSRTVHDRQQESGFVPAVVKRNQEYLTNVSVHGEINYGHMNQLLFGAIAEYCGRHYKVAERYYRKAFELAAAVQNIKYQALASEFLGELKLHSGQIEQSIRYLSDAEIFYREWGAKRKANLLIDRINNHVAATSNIYKADPLMSLIERFGAVRGFIIASHNQSLLVLQKRAVGNDLKALLYEGKQIQSFLSVDVVNYVLNSTEPVVVGPKNYKKLFSKDPYLMAVGQVPIVCVPIVSGPTVVGVVYLERRTARPIQSLEQYTAENAAELLHTTAEYISPLFDDIYEKAISLKET